MKLLIFLLVLCITNIVAAQSYPITNVTISLPTNPPANTANWATTLPPVMITAKGALQNGQLDGMVQESKMLVTIKRDGSKICGMFSRNSAPNAGFSSVVKNWNGAQVLTFLGQECTLQPGSYELCVQFFSVNTPTKELSIEVCKPFTIADAKEQTYSPPNNIMPTDKKTLTETEAKVLTLRWTPIVPKPKDPVTYRLKVWQLMQGQTGVQAMRTNAPIAEKEVTNITQAVLSNIYTGPCKPPYLCDYVWNVEATKTNPLGEIVMLGKSEPTEFKIENKETLQTATLSNVYPADKATFTDNESKTKPMSFRWTPIIPKPNESVIYKIKVYEQKANQLIEEAITSKPLYEQEVVDKIEMSCCSNTIEVWPIAKSSNYVWNVEALYKNGKILGVSAGTAFKIIVTDPSTGCFSLDTTQYKVECNGYDQNGKPKYILTNLILKNIGTNPGRTGLHNTPATNYITPTGFTVSGLIPASANPINVGNSINIGFEIIGATGTTVTFVVNSTIVDPTNPNLYCDKTIGVTVDLPPCPCTYCKEDMIKFNAPTSFIDNNTFLTVNQNITVTIPVKQFKAEIIGFAITPSNNNDQCLLCNKNSNQWGNFLSGTIPATFPSMTNGLFPTIPCCGGNSHHTIGWWTLGAALNISNKNISLNITLPPRTTLSCCPYRINFCIRYTFTDAECRSCSIINCYNYILNPYVNNPVIPVDMVPMGVSQINELK
jgi:hypothetical protein